MNINRVVLTGNLTRDPELRSTNNGFSICNLGIAVNTRRKNNATGEWEDRPNYFRVRVLGKQGENCAQYLSKGRPVAIDGRLEWRQWEDQNGQKREAVDVIAESVQFLAGREQSSNGSGGAGDFAASVPRDTGDFDTTPATPAPVRDDDIPF